jgi:hypothetical protein
MQTRPYLHKIIIVIGEELFRFLFRRRRGNDDE